MADDKGSEISGFSLLPEACIAIIISFTSPKDACTAAAVSLGFKSAVDSDTVWEPFLPPDYREIIDGSDSPLTFSSKKELYFWLCDSPLLLDGGKLSFGLHRSTGKKCYMLSPRQLQIAGTDKPGYWTWTSLPNWRFTEVAQLWNVRWLDIRAIFEGRMLSPNTNYAAYLVFGLSEDHFGLDYYSQASVALVRENGTKVEGGGPTSVHLTSVVVVTDPTGHPRDDENLQRGSSRFRPDDWVEVELGQFFIGDGDKCQVQIQLSETQHQ